MKTTKIISTLLLTIALVSCVNLKEVRDYAGESAKLSAYTELTTRFRDTYEREQPYLSGEADRQAQDNDKRRKAAYEDLFKKDQGVSSRHETKSKYMFSKCRMSRTDPMDVFKYTT